LNSEISKLASLARAEGRRNLYEHEALQLCARYGIPTPPFEVATSAEGAVTAAKRIRYPIAMKIVSPDILHKTEADGVALDIRNDVEAKDSYRRISSNVKQRNPQCRITGIIVERMIPKGTEIIVGALRDEQFGPAIMLGVGGILAELVRDVSFRVIPISKFDAYDLIDDLRFPAILKGFRGGPHADRETIVDILMKTSRMIVESPEIESLDLNPVVINEKSATVADARILLRDSSPNPIKES